MFSPVPMRRLRAVVLERDERAVLQRLGELGVVQLTRAVAGPDTAPLPPRNRSAEMARCDRLLARTEELRKQLAIPAIIQELQPPILTLEQAETSLSSLESRFREMFQRRQRLLQRWSELAAVSERVSGYRGAEIPLDAIGGFSFLHFVTGSLPGENLEQLQAAVGDNVALLPLQPQQGRQPLIVMTTRRNRPTLESALQRAGFQHETLPAVAGATPESLAAESRCEQEQVTAELGRLEDAMRSLAAEVAQPLADLERAVTVERRMLEAEQHFPCTDAAVLITGWIPADDAPALEQGIQRATGGRCAIATSEPHGVPEEEVPVLLRHTRLLQPFAMLVSGYGLPKYGEMVPTFFVAVSYVLMFGMMFGDAGHGALFALAGLWALRAGRNATTRDAGLLLLLCGLCSTVFGVVYGSYFGMTALKRFALWHDPLEGDPMMLMDGAMGIGVVIISLGLVLNIINRLRRGDALGALLDKFGVAGVVFYWGVLVLIAKFGAIKSRGLVNPALAVFVALPILAWVLKKPLEFILHRRAGRATEPGGLGMAIVESLVGAFEAVMSYLANTISFVRLAAYAMSHAALLMATFMMAAVVGHVSGAGGVLSVLVIIAGNGVAILLEGVVASVQALRLEYYEFFGKFFSGGGQSFKPFRLTPG